MSYVFGPVPSRRLGRSLGVDLVPFKTCTYDCIYCQLGCTTNKTTERKAWAPPDAVLADLRKKLASKPDYITLSGSGEPTLHAGLGELVAEIHDMTDVPVAVLTNGSLLWQPEVCDAVAAADLVVPSLDAGNEAMFKAVNRPHASLHFEQVLEGLIALRNAHLGPYWLEVFVLGGYTDDDAELEAMAESVTRIQPDRVQLNTVTRPPAEAFATTVPRLRLEILAERFTPKAEVIADFQSVHAQPGFSATRDTVLQMLERRPCSLDDIAEGLGIHLNEAIKYLEELLAEDRIEAVRTADRLFYRVGHSSQPANDMTAGQ